MAEQCAHVWVTWHEGAGTTRQNVGAALLPAVRKQGLSAEQVPVSAYGGSLKNLKDLKDWLREGAVRVERTLLRLMVEV